VIPGARRRSVWLGLVLATALVGCSPPSHTQPPDTPAADAQANPVTPARPNEPNTLTTASVLLENAMELGENAALRSSPSHDLGRHLIVEAHVIAGEIRDVRASHGMPSAMHRASQTVQAARWAASIPTAFPKPGGRASARSLKRAKRQRIKPGTLSIVYPKGGYRAKLQLFDRYGYMRPSAYMKLTQALFAPGHTSRGVRPWHAYDPRLFAMLYVVGQHYQRSIEIISAFRVPRSGGKKSSNHYRGRAIDFRVAGVSRRALLAYLDETFSRAGIGWYPNSSFLHLDTRPRGYWWTDTSGPGQSQKLRERTPRKKKRGKDSTQKSVHLSHKRLYGRW
jgi:hypothetical protein